MTESPSTGLLLLDVSVGLSLERERYICYIYIYVDTNNKIVMNMNSYCIVFHRDLKFIYIKRGDI